jgi:hypothetical protein
MMTIKKNKLIGLSSIMIIGILIFTACSNTQESPPVDTTLSTEEESTTDVIEETEVIEEAEVQESEDYGAKGAMHKTEYTLEEMMQYAIEDEYLAYAEYELILNEMNITKPFSNIIKAEETHIGYMEDLYETYGFKLPTIDPSQHVSLPESINDAYIAGVEAEIINIAMYESFLEQDLPEDVRSVFEKLKAGSESHLLAFQKNVQ